MEIGEIGESTLRQWASEAGMTCNPSVKDRFGWDFLLEMTAIDTAETIPFDRRNAKMSFFVQVKTTQSTSCRPKIKLSNWEYLVKEPIPTFIILIHLDENRQLIRAFLTHIGEEWIHRTLHSLRANTGKRLNHINMTFRAKPNDLLVEPYHDSMRKNLLKSIDGDFREYCARKIKLVEELGYGDFRSQITLEAEGKIDDLLDFAIGAKKGLQVRNVIINDDIRFGLPGSVAQFDEATMEAPAPAHNANLVLSNENGIVSNTVARLFLPNWMMKGIPNDKYKFRFESSFCEGVFGPKNSAKITFQLRFDLNNANIESLLPVANAVLILSDPESRAKLSIYRDDHTIITANVAQSRSPQSLPSDSLRSFATMIIDLQRIFSFFNMPTSDAIDFTDMYRQILAIRLMRASIDYSMRDKVCLRFTVPEKLEEARHIAVPRIISLVVGEKLLLIEGVYVGLPTFLGKAQDYEYMSTIRMELRKHLLQPASEPVDLKCDYEQLIREYQEEYSVIDFNAKNNSTQLGD